ncbi:hypothetical protein EVAR_6067_1 [Eumeta japonica]|uniref:Uncharacterized protein n=1 Tax=Eumeta variegata TaxID=151549 RepID=A0A4C1TH17_EUMVA|nr:hypothetical protein EVAR_6067_1 [Eumeta japonica]
MSIENTINIYAYLPIHCEHKLAKAYIPKNFLAGKLPHSINIHLINSAIVNNIVRRNGSNNVILTNRLRGVGELNHLRFRAPAFRECFVLFMRGRRVKWQEVAGGRRRRGRRGVRKRGAIVADEGKDKAQLTAPSRTLRYTLLDRTLQDTDRRACAPGPRRRVVLFVE